VSVLELEWSNQRKQVGQGFEVRMCVRKDAASGMEVRANLFGFYPVQSILTFPGPQRLFRLACRYIIRHPGIGSLWTCAMAD